MFGMMKNFVTQDMIIDGVTKQLTDKFVIVNSSLSSNGEILMITLATKSGSPYGVVVNIPLDLRKQTLIAGWELIRQGDNFKVEECTFMIFNRPNMLDSVSLPEALDSGLIADVTATCENVLTAFSIGMIGEALK